MRGDTIESLVEIMLGTGLVLLVLVAGVWLVLSKRPHHYGGPYGIPGGLERWQHRSYRWRRGLEAAMLVALAIVTVPSALEIMAGAGLTTLGLLWLARRVRPRRRRRTLYVLP